MESDGASAGIHLHDPVSGNLTLNLGTLHADENHMTMKINYRYPVTFSYADCAPKLNSAFESAGFVIENEFHKDKLKSDVVQAGHHGVANVSGECYDAIDAKVFLYSCCLHTWYLEWGSEAFGSHDPGMKRQHYFMKRRGVKDENIYTNNYGMLTFKLPIEIK